MAAMFYSGHRMKSQQQSFFYNWLALAKHKNGMTKGGSKKDQVRAAPPGIVIDTELANMQYENQAVMEQLASPEEGNSADPKIHIEGEEIDLSSQKSEEEEEEESDGDPDTL
jgi:hypothetical protein